LFCYYEARGRRKRGEKLTDMQVKEVDRKGEVKVDEGG
jgi:hypothetical protein